MELLRTGTLDFFFFLFEHCWQGCKYQARIPIEFDTEPFFPVFFFLNESGLLSRVGQLGDMTIYINGIRCRFYTTWYTSLPTVCNKTCTSFNGLFSFPIPVFPWSKEVLLQNNDSSMLLCINHRKLIKMQNPRPHPL